jgi:hypothetical protein
MSSINDIPPEQRLVVMRGDDFDKIMDLSFATGDLTGVTKIWMTVKFTGQTDEDAAIQITTDPSDGVTVLDATSARFFVSNTIMAGLEVTGRYRYDVQCLLASGEIKTGARGQFVVVEDYTLTII